MEFWTAGGLGFMQKRNDVISTAETHLGNFKTAIAEFPEEANNDLILGGSMYFRLKNQAKQTLIAYHPSYLAASDHLKIASVAAGVTFSNHWEVLLPVLLVNFGFELWSGVRSRPARLPCSFF